MILDCLDCIHVVLRLNVGNRCRQRGNLGRNGVSSLEHGHGVQQFTFVRLADNKLLSISQRLVYSVGCVNSIAVGGINIPVCVTRQSLAVFVNALAIDVLDSVDDILGCLVGNNLNALVGPIRAIEHGKSGGNVSLSDRQNESALLVRLNEALGRSGSGFSRASKCLGNGGLRRNRSRHSGAIGSNGSSNAVQRVKIRLQSHLIRASGKCLVAAEARQREGDFLRCLQLAIGNLRQRVMVRLAQLHFLGAEANVASIGIRNSGQRTASGFGSYFACRHLERTVVVAAINIQANEDVGLIIVVSNHEVGVVYHSVAVQNIIATRQSRPDDGQLIVGFFSSNQLVIVGNFSLAEVHQGIVTRASGTNGRTVSVSHGLRQLGDGIDNRLSSGACAFQLGHVGQGQFKDVLRGLVERFAVLLQQRDRRRSGQHVGGHGNLELVETVGGLLAHDGLIKRCVSHNTHEDAHVAGGRGLEANLHRAVVNEQRSIGHLAHGKRRVVAVLVDAGSNVVRAAQNAHLRGVHDNRRVRAVGAACGQVVIAAFGQGHRCLAFSVRGDTFKFGHRTSRCIHRGQLDAFYSGGSSLHGSAVLVHIAVHGGNTRHSHFKGSARNNLSRGFDVRVLVGIRIGLIGVELNEVTAVDLRGGDQGAIVAAERRLSAIVRRRMVHEEAIGSIGTEVRLHPTGVRPI